MNALPRVVYVITDSGTGGAERKLTDILKTLDRSKFTPVGVIVLKKKRETALEWEKTGVPVFELGLGRWPRTGNKKKLLAKIKELSADIVHSLTLRSVLICRSTRKDTGAFKLASSPCLNFRMMPFYIKWLVRGSAQWDDAVVCESTATREFLVNDLGHDPKKAIFVPNSIDTNRFNHDEAGREAVRLQWGASASDIIVGTVGRLHEQKGFDVFIEAFDALKKFPVRGVIVGEGKEGEKLQSLINQRSARVTLTGKMENMTGVLSALDIYVQSSRYEGMSRALMEAMSTGRPIVATAVDGTMDLAQDGDNMLLCRVEDPSSLSLGIATLAEKPELRKKLSQGARATAERFTVDKMVRQLEKIYQDIQ